MVISNNTNRTTNMNSIDGVISDGPNAAMALMLTSPGPTNAGTQWNLSQANTYSGGTTLTRLNTGGPVLRISNSQALGTGPVSWLQTVPVLRANAADLNLANAINVASATATVASNGNTFTLSGLISGANGFSKFADNGTLILANAGNSYGGATTVGAGTLSFSSAVNGGSPSNLGSSGNAANNLLLGNGSTLQYTGAGGSTDRLFTINGTATGHGANLDASGSGAISYTNTGNIAFGTVDQARTLTLTGANAGGNILASTLNNNGTGYAGLTKSGLGQWEVTGTNTHSGQTVVNTGGTLKLGNASALGGSALVTGLVQAAAGNTFTTTSNAFVSGQFLTGTGFPANTRVTATATTTGVTTVTLNFATTEIVTSATVAGSTQVNSGGTLALNGQTISERILSIAGTGVGGLGALVNNITTPAVITSQLGTGNVSGSGGQSPGSFTVGGAGNISLDTVTSNAGFTLTKIGSGTLTMGGIVDNSSSTGILNDGTVVVNKSALGHVFNVFTQNGGLLQYGANNVPLLNGTGQINATTINGGVFDLNGSTDLANTTIGNLNAALAGGTILNNVNGTTATLSIGGNNVTNTGYAGAIVDNNNAGSGKIALRKVGTGIQTLSGDNTYTGGTTVVAGTLAVDGDALPDSGSLVLNGGNVAVTGTEVVNTLFVGAEQKGMGTYTNADISAITSGSIQVLTGPAGFSSWITGTFAGGATVPGGLQGPNADPDNDGISNLVEYAIAGQDPTVSNTNIGSYIGNTLSFSKNTAATGLTYAIVESTDLGISDIWSEVTNTPGYVVYVNDPTTISVAISVTTGSPAKDFVRLRVTDN